MSDEPPYVHFPWDARDPKCERNNVRCPQCGCLHVWVEGPPEFCSSCGIEFRWGYDNAPTDPNHGGKIWGSK